MTLLLKQTPFSAYFFSCRVTKPLKAAFDMEEVPV